MDKEKEQKEQKPKKEKKERKKSDDNSDGEDNVDDIEKVSYTYWKRDADMQADHKGFQPPKATEVKQPEENNKQNKVASAWNKAGTWEEKKLKKEQIMDFLNDYIKNNKKLYKDTFTLDDFSDFSGDVYYVFSRGKIKFIYDFEIKLQIRGDNECKDSVTTITIKEISNADLDEDFEYEYDSVSKKVNAKKHQLIQVFKGNYKDVQNDIRKMLEDLKNHYLE